MSSPNARRLAGALTAGAALLVVAACTTDGDRNASTTGARPSTISTGTGADTGTPTTSIPTITVTPRTVPPAGPAASTTPGATGSPSTVTVEPTNPSRALCATSRLRLSATYLGAGATEQTLGRIVLTNTGTGRCVIQGYPGVSLLDGSGRTANRPAVRVLSRNTAAFTIAPGESASTVLVDNVTSTTGQDCLSTNRSVTVKVFPPNQLDALSAPLAMNPCYLSVQPLQFGANAQPR